MGLYTVVLLLDRYVKIRRLCYFFVLVQSRRSVAASAAFTMQTSMMLKSREASSLQWTTSRSWKSSTSLWCSATIWLWPTTRRTALTRECLLLFLLLMMMMMMMGQFWSSLVHWYKSDTNQPFTGIENHFDFNWPWNDGTVFSMIERATQKNAFIHHLR